ncbi:major facilitator superfamily transporter [Microdochium bolleyi]|uniref:Major facilitator superfamily transporter n=1 Tax=Microdochium bolleyi TaxID=196109 RepID=A0A136IPJ3_9PEZI|nr:major facilitator superfamily transporter [Microdochium bolleyi]
MAPSIEPEKAKHGSVQGSPERSESGSEPAEFVAAEAPPEWSPSRHELLIILVLSMLSLNVSLDASVIITALNAMVVDLDSNATQGFWIGTAYLLANAVTMPLIAAISDVFGRTLCLMCSLIFFTAGTILCCVASSITVLLVGRSLQGIGGGGVYVLSLVIFTDIVPLRFRPKWYGAILGAWALGTCTGPPIGGAIAAHTTWRWVFYMMFPILGLGLVAVPLLLTLKPPAASLQNRLSSVDWVGGLLFTGSMTSFLIAISWGGSQHPWSSVQTIVPLVLGTCGIAAAIGYEGWWAKRPVLLPALFHDLSSTITYICGGSQGLLLFGCFYYMAWFFIAVKQYSALDAGIALLPALVSTVPGSIVSGALVTRLGKYRWAIWTGWLLSTIGLALTATLWDRDTSTPVWATSLVILGLGQGAVLNAQNFAAQAQCKAGDEGAAAAMYGFVRQLGSALGVGIGGSIFQNVMALKLGWQGLDTGIAADSEAFVEVLKTLPDSSEFKMQVLDAYAFGFRGVFRAFLGLSAVCFLLSLMVKHHDMNRDISTVHKLEGTKSNAMVEFRIWKP